tara:strand:- start:220 stop:990 length:771 start_codon:yes stop_codon:yes gene_type:complete
MDSKVVPKLVFIVPYRDRIDEYNSFVSEMQNILEDYDKESYKILFIHQCDERSFNRGAMKNIGFLFVKNKYPKDYENITLVFNDLDTIPSRKGLLNYYTKQGTVKHFYGFYHALGGIFSITGKDFESTYGFPNLWTWGYEDNRLNMRVMKKNLKIDRTTFFEGKDPNILHKLDSGLKTINKFEFDKYAANINDGHHTITDLKYNYEEDTGFVNIIKFNVPHIHKKELDIKYHLKNGLAPFKRSRRQATMQMVNTKS